MELFINVFGQAIVVSYNYMEHLIVAIALVLFSSMLLKINGNFGKLKSVHILSVLMIATFYFGAISMIPKYPTLTLQYIKIAKDNNDNNMVYQKMEVCFNHYEKTFQQIPISYQSYMNICLKQNSLNIEEKTPEFFKQQLQDEFDKYMLVKKQS